MSALAERALSALTVPSSMVTRSIFTAFSALPPATFERTVAPSCRSTASAVASENCEPVQRAQEGVGDGVARGLECGGGQRQKREEGDEEGTHGDCPWLVRFGRLAGRRPGCAMSGSLQPGAQ